jgi:hypothetical protein
MSIVLTEAYAAREIRFLQLWTPAGWAIKCYGIAHPARGMPTEAVIAAAQKVLALRLPGPGDRSHYGVGFLIVHVAREAVFVLLDLWTGENMLRQQLLTSALDNQTEFRDLGSTGLMACVWEMQVQSYERQAWIDTVLKKPNGSDFSAYLSLRLNAIV